MRRMTKNLTLAKWVQRSTENFTLVFYVLGVTSIATCGELCR